MYAKPEKVGPRRLRRRLKAVASIAVALCAGVFLACQKTVPTGGPEDAGTTSDAAEDAVTDTGAPDAEAGTQDAAVDASKALVRVGGRDASAVDRKEHRKGMPVPDNLLE